MSFQFPHHDLNGEEIPLIFITQAVRHFALCLVLQPGLLAFFEELEMISYLQEKAFGFLQGRITI